MIIAAIHFKMSMLMSLVRLLLSMIYACDLWLMLLSSIAFFIFSTNPLGSDVFTYIDISDYFLCLPINYDSNLSCSSISSCVNLIFNSFAGTPPIIE